MSSLVIQLSRQKPGKEGKPEEESAEGDEPSGDYDTVLDDATKTIMNSKDEGEVRAALEDFFRACMERV